MQHRLCALFDLIRAVDLDTGINQLDHLYLVQLDYIHNEHILLAFEETAPCTLEDMSFNITRQLAERAGREATMYATFLPLPLTNRRQLRDPVNFTCEGWFPGEEDKSDDLPQLSANHKLEESLLRCDHPNALRKIPASHGLEAWLGLEISKPEAQARPSQHFGLAWLAKPWLGTTGFWLQAQACTSLDAGGHHALLQTGVKDMPHCGQCSSRHKFCEDETNREGESPGSATLLEAITCLIIGFNT
ncbi:hypothetical protein C8F04DRAFT_1188104 [Mycena alexandri]|uniref:Uncharacterized protein n=1 Tax=Mycena alexandri TaxID=1745969 RepID=A0AAD6WZ93_9AGAR|nr:hypothetical protein C8F04DRAFT_1188104 [Mycena alexandri]